jgi:DNA-binding LytR/AlgR family response regulator
VSDNTSTAIRITDAIGNRAAVILVRDLRQLKDLRLLARVDVAVICTAPEVAERAIREVRQQLEPAETVVVGGDDSVEIEGVRRIAIAEFADVFQELLQAQGSAGLKPLPSVVRIHPQKYRRRLLVRRRTKAIPLKTEQVEWLEAAGNYVRVHVGTEAFLLRTLLGHIEQELDPDEFQRISRSIIVNLNFVKDIRPDYKGDYIITLVNGTELKLTRAYRDAVLGQFSSPQEPHLRKSS